MSKNKTLGRDMGGCKTYGGRKTYQRTRSPENFWTPPKELLFCSVVDFCTGKTEHWHLRGWKTYRARGGPKPLLGRGVIREVFLPPLFPSPHGVLWKQVFALPGQPISVNTFCELFLTWVCYIEHMTKPVALTSMALAEPKSYRLGAAEMKQNFWQYSFTCFDVGVLT